MNEFCTYVCDRWSERITQMFSSTPKVAISLDVNTILPSMPKIYWI